MTRTRRLVQDANSRSRSNTCVCLGSAGRSSLRSTTFPAASVTLPARQTVQTESKLPGDLCVPDRTVARLADPPRLSSTKIGVGRSMSVSLRSVFHSTWHISCINVISRFDRIPRHTARRFRIPHQKVAQTHMTRPRRRDNHALCHPDYQRRGQRRADFPSRNRKPHVYYW